MLKRLFVTVALMACFVLANSNVAGAAVEPFYTYLGIGWAITTYPDELEYVVEDLKDAPGVDTLSPCLDLGFYWPLPNKKSILGIVANGAADRYSGDGEWLQINSYLIGLSSMNFFGSEPGAGLFIRADAGVAWHSFDSSFGDSDSSDVGYGFLVGVGYGIPVSEGTRILLNVNYALRHVEKDDTSVIGFSLGGLF